jgi:hypothetical protein
VVRLRRLIDQLEGLWLVAVLDVEESGVRLEDGAASLAGWLRARARLAPGEAQAKAKLAWALVEQLPLTQAAIAEGRIGVRHAQVIDQVVRQVPAKQRPGVEAVLVPAAGELDPLQLRRLGAQVVYRLDTEAVDAAAVRRYERRGLSVAATVDGLVHLNGLLDPVAGATVMTAIDALVAPSRVSLDDSRSGSQRRADALTQLCQTFLDAGAAGAAGAPAGNVASFGPHSPDQPDRSERSDGAQLRGGVRPHLSVIIDLATLRAQPGHPMAELGWVGPVTARQARLIACDAVVSRVVMSCPTAALRRAPHRVLGGRRSHLGRQLRAAVPTPSPLRPPTRLDRDNRPRRTKAIVEPGVVVPEQLGSDHPTVVVAATRMGEACCVPSNRWTGTGPVACPRLGSGVVTDCGSTRGPVRVPGQRAVRAPRRPGHARGRHHRRR